MVHLDCLGIQDNEVNQALQELEVWMEHQVYQD
jgi:hypothetical protein